MYEYDVKLNGPDGGEPIEGRATISDPNSPQWTGKLDLTPYVSERGEHFSFGPGDLTVRLADGRTAPAHVENESGIVTLRGLGVFS